MSTSKRIDQICVIALVLVLIITTLFINAEKLGVQAVSAPVGYESRLFNTSTVHSIDIVMDDWNSFIENCRDETYETCAVIIDGDAYKNVAIRAKGNTSLSQVDSYGNNRYSFKIEFDHYDNANSYYGLDKLCLNNIIQDNTYMKDYLSYQLMRLNGVDAPLCSYAYITVNGEDWGLYLAVEAVEDAFLQRSYGNDYGELYKPDSSSLGGGRGNGRNFEMPEDFDGEFDAAPPDFNGDSDAAPPDFNGNSDATPPDFNDNSDAVPPDFNGNSDTTLPDFNDNSDAVSPDFNDNLDSESPDSNNNENKFSDSKPDKSNSDIDGASEGINDTNAGMNGERSDNDLHNNNDERSGNDLHSNNGIRNGNDPHGDNDIHNDSGMHINNGERGGNGVRGENDVSLIYTDDEYESYSNIFDNAKTDISDNDKERLIASLKQLNEGENIDSVVDIEKVLRYFVVHNFVLNFDSYTGSMIHNYYLYENDGQLSMIPWDYNLAFSGFTSGSDAASLVNYPIDTPISGGSIESRPMLAWIFNNEEYTNLYHQYLGEFISEYFDSGYFSEMIDSVTEMISPYVEKDPTKFCTYEEFKTGSSTLKEFCLLRAQSIEGQLDGSIPTTADGQSKDSSAFIDANDIDTSSMGSMGMGGERGGFHGNNRKQDGFYENNREQDNSHRNSQEQNDSNRSGEEQDNLHMNNQPPDNSNRPDFPADSVAD